MRDVRQLLACVPRCVVGEHRVINRATAALRQTAVRQVVHVDIVTAAVAMAAFVKPVAQRVCQLSRVTAVGQLAAVAAANSSGSPLRRAA